MSGTWAGCPGRRGLRVLVMAPAEQQRRRRHGDERSTAPAQASASHATEPSHHGAADRAGAGQDPPRSRSLTFSTTSAYRASAPYRVGS